MLPLRLRPSRCRHREQLCRRRRRHVLVRARNPLQILAKADYEPDVPQSPARNERGRKSSGDNGGVRRRGDGGCDWRGPDAVLRRR